jgi:ABC-2 type transport system ATP-binding protein
MSARGLRCRGCSKSYGKTRALIDVTLHVSPGEVVGLVGPNGAGKTTLLHSIVGLCKLDTGGVTIDGMPASKPEAKRQMAFMPDDLPRPRHLTATEVLKLSCRLYGVAFDSAVVDELAQSLDLGGRLDQTLGGYSHGMARKVDLIAALLVSPSVLLLDEPFSGMDPVVVEVICGLLEVGKTTGRMALLSTHELELAAKVADRVVMLSAGRVIFDDSLEVLVSGDGSGDIREAFKTLARG